MSKQENAQTDLETRILNKILATLYLDLVPTSGDMRSRTEETLDKVNGYFGTKRPSVLEMRHSIEERIKSDQDLGSEMRTLIGEELAVFGKIKFGQDFGSEMRARIEERFDAILAEGKEKLSSEGSPEERQRLLESIVADILGFGPLEPLLSDGSATEIMVDGPNKIYVERAGKFQDVPYRFRDEGDLMGKIHRILAPLGRKLDESNPIVDARLPDGSLVNVVIPPISLIGPALTLRRFAKQKLTWEDLLRFGSWSEDIVEFLRACVRARLNIVVAGGAGSGKTTILNLITEMIPEDERIVIVEARAELQPSEKLEHLVRLEGRPPDWGGKGEITVRDLVINALRMRPDRIITSEVHGAEVLDLLRAMNTGHDGSLINVHAAGPQDVLERLETMVMMAGPWLPLPSVRQEIASAIDLITYQERVRDGSRKIMKVTEVTGVQGDVIMLQDIFEFRQTGFQEGRVAGYHTATGYIPRFLKRITEAGIELPMSMFVPA